MGNFFSSFFSSSKDDDSEESKKKNEQKNFDIFKYDGMRAQRIGQLAYSIKCFTEALKIREDFETMEHLATSYIMAQKIEDALELLNRMLEIQPDNVNCRLRHVELLFMLDRDAEAIPDCEYIIERDENNAAAWFLQGKAKRTTSDLLGAIADFTKAISLRPDFIDAYLTRAHTLLSMGQAEEALPDVKKAIELNPEEETSYLLSGRIHAALGKPDEAAADFQNTLQLNPFNEDAMILTGQLLIAQNRLDEAIQFFDDAIEMKPEFSKAYAERGRAKNLKGDKEGAFNDMKKSIELNPEGEAAQQFEGQHTNFNAMYKGGIY